MGALGQATFISGSAIFLLFEAGNRLLNPQPLHNSAVGIAVMVFAILATLLLVGYQRHVIRQTNSLAIKADALHYFGDLLINGSVIVALLLVAQFGWTFIDPLFAIGIALYILHTAWRIARSALDILMDHELPDEDRKRIRAIAMAHPEVQDLHDLRTRGAGPSSFIQLHIEMDGTMTLYEAHAVADAVETEIRTAFPGAEVIIHQDPVGRTEKQARFG